MSEKKPNLTPEIYRLELRPEGNHPAPPIIRLRRFLKMALRAYGLRCTGVSEAKPDEPIRDYSPGNPGSKAVP